MRNLFKRKAYIAHIFISQLFRDTGLSSLMLGEGLKVIAGTGLEKMATIISQNNKDSLGFFAKMGFNPSHRLYYLRIGPFRKHFLLSY